MSKSSRNFFKLSGGALLLALLLTSFWFGQAAQLGAKAAITLDGVRDASYVLLAEDPSNDLANPGPGEATSAQWADLSHLYAVDDGSYLYVYVTLPNYAQSSASGEIGLAIESSGDIAGSGGSSDPWGNAITFAYTATHHNVGQTPLSSTHTLLPDAVVRGNLAGNSTPPNDDNGWTELRTWNGSSWDGGGVNWGGLTSGAQVGTHIAYADNAGVEFKIAYAELGVSAGSTLHLQVYATQKATTSGAFDSSPSDDQSSGWDDATTQKHLASYILSGTPPTPENTPTEGPGGDCASSSAGDGTIVDSALYHNSLDTAYREPLGSIEMTGTATLRLRSCEHDIESVEVLVWETGAGATPSHIYTASVAYTESVGSYAIWEVAVPGPGTQIDQWYQFRISDSSSQGYYHVADSSNSGPGAWSSTWVNQSWRLATSAGPIPDVDDVPSWIQDAVVYQIFPDRFRNGDSATDASIEGTEVYGSGGCDGYPHPRPGGATSGCIHDLRAWDDALLNPSWGMDYHGGDLRGVIQKIDDGYFSDLGVNTLYFNPIFEASSNHGYDTNDYYTIRGYFGSEADFDELINKAHAAGIRIILDAVFNHAGMDSAYIDHDKNNNGACAAVDSPYRAWFVSGSQGATFSCADGWGWNGWYGNEPLPEIVDDNDDVRDFFFRGGSSQIPAAANGMSVAEYWIAKGIDGWRFDVAQDISHDWFAEMRPYLKDSEGEHYGDPEILILGEVTGGCASGGLYESYTRGDELDAVMNYCFRDWIAGYASGNSPSFFDNSFNDFRAQYPSAIWYAMLNLISSHDSPRLYEMVGQDYNNVKLALLLQMTLPGAPSVYYGDEIGLPGGSDPDNRRPYPWGSPPDPTMYAHFKTLIGIRNAHSALRGGDFETLLVDDSAHLYSFVRWDEHESIVVALKNVAGDASNAVIPVSEHFSDGSVLTDTLNSNSTYTVSAGSVSVPLNGRWGVILVGAASEPANQPPHIPSAPSPADAANNVPLNPTLRWSGDDPDGDLVTYTIALDSHNPPTTQISTTLNAYSPTLQANTRYYWQITASDGISSSLGALWTFSTAPAQQLYLPLLLKSN